MHPMHTAILATAKCVVQYYCNILILQDIAIIFMGGGGLVEYCNDMGGGDSCNTIAIY